MRSPRPEDIFPLSARSGTIIQLLRLPDGTVKVLVEGKSRALHSTRWIQSNDPYFLVHAEVLEDGSAETAESQALVRTVHTLFESYVKLNKKVPSEVLTTISSITDPGKLSDTIVAHLNLKVEERQALLENVSPIERLEDVSSRIEGEIEVLEVERKIRGRVKKQMEKSAEGVLPQRADAGDPEGAWAIATKFEERDR